MLNNLLKQNQNGIKIICLIGIFNICFSFPQKSLVNLNPIIQTDFELLQGTWQVIRLNENSEETPPEWLQYLYWTFDGNRLITTKVFTVTENGKTHLKGQGGITISEFTLDMKTFPKQMKTITVKPFKGVQDTSIYRLEDDKLELCESVEPGSLAPSKFYTTPEKGIVIAVLKRISGPNPNDFAAIQGTWQAVEWNEDSRDLPIDQIQNFQLEVEWNQFIATKDFMKCKIGRKILQNRNKLYMLEYKLNPGTIPKQIIFLSRKLPKPERITWIYKFDEDTLEICGYRQIGFPTLIKFFEVTEKGMTRIVLKKIPRKTQAND